MPRTINDFRTMLAGKVDDVRKIRFPVLASPKLDGVRVHVINGVAVSRNLIAFKHPGIQRVFGQKRFNGLDGEFIAGDPLDPHAFRKCGVLNSHAGDISDVKMHVFDDFQFFEKDFERRLAGAHDRIKSDTDRFAPVPHIEIDTPEALLEYEAECLAAGYEGVMVRDPVGRYKFGRSTASEGLLLKIKQFEDSEAVIDDAEELMHNANEKTLMKAGKAVRNTKKEGKVGRGVLGAVVVRDLKTGVQFNVGSGFDAAERSALWAQHQAGTLKGQIIRYRYFPSGSKDKPRFPTFTGFRHPDDV